MGVVTGKHVRFDEETDEFYILRNDGGWQTVYNGSSMLDFPDDFGATEQAKAELQEMFQESWDRRQRSTTTKRFTADEVAEIVAAENNNPAMKGMLRLYLSVVERAGFRIVRD